MVLAMLLMSSLVSGGIEKGGEGLERRDSIGGKNEFSAPDRVQLEALLGKLQRGVPERLLKVRRALRHRNHKVLEIELLKLSAALPPVGAEVFQKLLPPEQGASDQEWDQVRAGLSHLEQALDQLREGLEKLLN